MRIIQLDTLRESKQCVRVNQNRTYKPSREGLLASNVLVRLEEIGIALDEDRPLRVFNNGLVVLDDGFKTITDEKEKVDERHRKRRPKTRPRKRSARRKRTSRGSRQAFTEPRIGGNVLSEDYKNQLTRLAEAYPTLQPFSDDDGIWLQAESSILSGLARKAIFLVALPYKIGLGPRAWGFWSSGNRFWWIGPRHTNFLDGSICAFAQIDQVWSEGGDLRRLLDIYSGWTLRHLYLEVCGRWPGKQYALLDADPLVQAFYRRMQCKSDELCGCGSNSRRYAECCMPHDLRLNLVQLTTHFKRHIEGGFESRKPPDPIESFVNGRSTLPRMADVHLLIGSS